MSREEVNERLSHISTDWGALKDAHRGDDIARAAQTLLILRYGPAVRRYLTRIASDAESADDLFQEFGLAIIEGKLKSADPDRGRFRDYVKSVLRHLVAKSHTKRKKATQPAGGESANLETVAAPEQHDELDEPWRDNLLARAWAALADANHSAHDILRFQVENNQLSSKKLAEEWTAKLGKPVKSDGVRQMIRRARKLLALLLIEEVKHSLATPTIDAVIQELEELRLLKYCKSALEE